jgi:secreted trypsin-like serine protease
VLIGENATLTGWQILDDQSKIAFSGDKYLCNDSVDFTLKANSYYFLKISVSEVFNSDTALISLRINGEPILLIKPEIGPGDHLIPFFTGIRSMDVKITGGTDALISDFPWQVYFESANFLCGGSIISDGWVVTAAHCTIFDNGLPISPSQMTVKVGATDPTNAGEGQNYSISQAIIHEGFNSQTLLNDIALLKVNGPISFPNAVPIKLVTPEDVAQGVILPGVMSWVTGWGLTKVSPNVFPTALQKVQLPIVSNEQASTVWSSIPATDIMAGFRLGNKDACNGDSGGPMTVPVFGVLKLAGIVSWGSSACNNYGAYTRVSDFVAWVRKNTGIPIDFKPPDPAGDTLICQGVISSRYSVPVVTSATNYDWQLIPADAGAISGNSENITVVWNTAFIGKVEVVLRVTINNQVSDWSRINVNIVQNTRLLSQSKDTTICEGQPIILRMVTEGYKLNYAWSKDGQQVQSGASSQFSIQNAATNNSGVYSCQITGSCGTVLSSAIKLTVLPLTNISFISPDTEVPFGNDVTLQVIAGGYNLKYQWQKDGTLIVKSDTSKLFIAHVNATDIGLYQSTVIGTCGTEKSKLIYLYVKREVISAEPEVFVWPTITSSIFNVALSNASLYTVQIFSSNGQLMRDQTNCQYQTVFNLSTKPRGVYIVKVFNSSFRKSIKVIKD